LAIDAPFVSGPIPILRQMVENRYKYTVEDIAFVIPTKDRPQKVKNLLTSLVDQGLLVGRVIIVATGQDIEETVTAYSDQLPVEYHHTTQPGQIRQRNLGLSLLDDRTKLVGCLDDDVVLESNALAAIVEFWNEAEAETAGVGFNITNDSPNKHSFFKSLFFSSSPEPGKVLVSGKSTKLTNISSTVRTNWLNGGATIWKQSILTSQLHQEVNVRWAIFEDAIFSYPIGKHKPFYVCADAHVRHEHVFDHTAKQDHAFYGKNKILWQYYFVISNKDLSLAAFYWSVVGGIVAKTMTGFGFRKHKMQETIGELQGVLKVTRHLFSSRDIKDLLENG